MIGQRKKLLKGGTGERTTYDELLIMNLRDLSNWSDIAWREYAESGKQLISQAADAIEELQQIAAHYEEAAKDYFKDVCYYLERVPKWIPVTERLPLRGDAVLCVGDNGISVADFVCGDKWCALPWFYVDGEQETNVTHWMPLPEPPKEV